MKGQSRRRGVPRGCSAPVVALISVLLTAPAAAETATLRAVRQITAPATTRLIVELSAPVHYRLQRVASRPDLGVPPRLYVDLLETRLQVAVPIAFAPAEGPLARVHASQRDRTTTRLILDVPGLNDFGVFSMPDPYRLIIDVRGTPRAGPPRPHAVEVAGRGTVEAPATRPAPHSGRDAAPTASASRQASARVALGREAPPAPRRSRRFKIVLDPGHGGKDTGAIGVGGLAEKDVVLAIARRLQQRLAELPDVDVVLTRDSDVFLRLEERTARANVEQADLFVSIHANASTNPSVSGVETYYLNNAGDHATLRLAAMENGLGGVTGHHPDDPGVSLILSDLIQNYKVQESVALAERIQQALTAALRRHGTPVEDLGVKRGPFYVLVGAGMPCVLVEVSFLTHPEEGARLAEPAYQDAIADGLLHGIRRFVDNTAMAGTL